MSSRWLSGLLRARQAQEDAAQVRLAQARVAAAHAHGRVRYHAERLDTLVAADCADLAPAFTAAAAALQAAAATHAAATSAAAAAETDVSARREHLTDAVTARRSAEELHQQHQNAIREGQARLAIREMDEVAARVRRGAGQEPA